MHRFHFAPLLALWIALIAALTGCAAPDPGAMRAAAVTSLTRAALATGMRRLDTNYPERYPSDLTDAEWALRS